MRRGAGLWLGLTLLVMLLAAAMVAVRFSQLSGSRRVTARTLSARIVQEAAGSAIRAVAHQLARANEERGNGQLPEGAFAAPDLAGLFEPTIARALRVSEVLVKVLTAPTPDAPRGVLRFQVVVSLTGGGLTCRRRIVGLYGFTVDPLLNDALVLDPAPLALTAEAAS